MSHIDPGSAVSPTGLRFPRTHRLVKGYQFDAVFKHRSISHRTDCIRIIGLANGETHPRLGLIVAKRILPRAVDRNRVKRLIRETFRNRVPELPAIDLIVQPLTRDVLTKLPSHLETLLDRVVAASI